MAQQRQPGAQKAQRIFEQPPDAISLYSDIVQILATGHEIIMQFYETIPGPPGSGGQVEVVRTRLRATIAVSIPHATNIGNLILEQIQGGSQQPSTQEGEGQS